MNQTEYMLNKLSQECIEVAKEISKALEFGLEDWNPDILPYRSNKLKIESELNDLIGVLDIIFEKKILDKKPIYSILNRNKKRMKIIKWMKHARKVGALQ